MPTSLRVKSKTTSIAAFAGGQITFFLKSSLTVRMPLTVSPKRRVGGFCSMTGRYFRRFFLTTRQSKGERHGLLKKSCCLLSRKPLHTPISASTVLTPCCGRKVVPSYCMWAVGNWLSEKNLRNTFPAASSFDGRGMPCRRCVAGHFCTLQLRKIPFIY